MDDCISAVDANVKKRLFKKVFKGLLEGKTRVLVTHAVDFLEHVDKIVIMKEGRIVNFGTYEELLSCEYFKQVLATLHETHEQDIGPIDEESLSEDESYTPIEERLIRKFSHVSEDLSRSLISTRKSMLMKNEDKEIISVPWTVYISYLLINCNWIVVLFFCIPLTVIGAWAGLQKTDITVHWMSEFDTQKHKFTYYFYGYLIFMGILALSTFLVWYALRFFLLHAGNTIFKRMSRAVA